MSALRLAAAALAVQHSLEAQAVGDADAAQSLAGQLDELDAALAEVLAGLAELEQEARRAYLGGSPSSFRKTFTSSSPGARTPGPGAFALGPSGLAEAVRA